MEDDISQISHISENICLTSSEDQEDEEKLPDQKTTYYLYFTVFSLLLGPFMNGFNTGILNIPQSAIMNCEGNLEKYYIFPPCFRMSAPEWGLVVSVFQLGGFIAALRVSFFTQRWGMRKVLKFNNFIFIFGTLCLSLAPYILIFVLGRFCLGFASGNRIYFYLGTATAIIPQYVADISPIRSRGKLCSLTQLSISVGSLTGQILGLFFSYSPGWRILLSLAAVPAILQFILLGRENGEGYFCSFSIQESPIFLLSKEKFKEARKALFKLRQEYNEDEVNYLISYVNRKKHSSRIHKYNEITLRKLLFDPKFSRSLWTIISIHLAQQLCGINAINQYSTFIFEKLLGPDSNAREISVALGTVSIITNITSSYIVEHVGRKPLLLFSIFMTVIFLSGFVLAAELSWFVVGIIFLAAFRFFFGIGLGPITWIMVPEIIPVEATEAGTLLATSINWSGNFLVTLLFPYLNVIMGNFSLIPFAVTNFLCGLILLITLVETKGKSVAEIHKLMTEGKK